MNVHINTNDCTASGTGAVVKTPKRVGSRTGPRVIDSGLVGLWWLASGEVSRGEKMLYSGTDPVSYITEYTLVYEERHTCRKRMPRSVSARLDSSVLCIGFRV